MKHEARQTESGGRGTTPTQRCARASQISEWRAGFDCSRADWAGAWTDDTPVERVRQGKSSSLRQPRLHRIGKSRLEHAGGRAMDVLAREGHGLAHRLD